MVTALDTSFRQKYLQLGIVSKMSRDIFPSKREFTLQTTYRTRDPSLILQQNFTTVTEYQTYNLPPNFIPHE